MGRRILLHPSGNQERLFLEIGIDPERGDKPTGGTDLEPANGGRSQDGFGIEPRPAELETQSRSGTLRGWKDAIDQFLTIHGDDHVILVKDDLRRQPPAVNHDVIAIDHSIPARLTGRHPDPVPPSAEADLDRSGKRWARPGEHSDGDGALAIALPLQREVDLVRPKDARMPKSSTPQDHAGGVHLVSCATGLKGLPRGIIKSR